MRLGPRARGLLTVGSAASVLAVSGQAAAGPTNLQETTPLIWAMTIISAAGAIATYAILVYALYRFRDPATKGRKYG